MFENKTIVVLAPHTDDGELGCGGTICRALEEGGQVYYIAFSTADESVPSRFPKNQLKVEVRDAMSILGIAEDHLIIYDFRVRKLNYVRQEVLEELIRLRALLSPDIVFTPSRRDIHQDHSTITKECIRAFKFCSILGYELIWNNLGFEGDYFIKISAEQLAKKVEALASYKTQEGKSYMDPTFIRSMAKVRGIQIGSDFAEAFETIRWIV